MAKKLKCSICDKSANFHLTQIVDNKIHKVDLCESCAQKKGVTDAEGFSLADLLVNPAPAINKDKAQLKCPTCGLTTTQFRKRGRFGCMDCYETFRSILLTLLEDMHEGTSHKGKIPAVALDRQSSQLRLKKLQTALARAIEEEAYEEAAKYRDQIKELEVQGDVKT